MPGKSLISKRLRSQMERRSINSPELARRAGVKTSFVYDVLSGKSANPSPVKLAAMAKVLGLPLGKLVGSETMLEELQAQSADQAAVQALEPRAGTHTYFFRKSWLHESLKANAKDLRMLHIEGDSMAPELQHGDLIMLNIKVTGASPAGLYAIDDGNGISIRQVETIAHHKKPRLRVAANNKKYKAYECSTSDIRIIGRVVWFARCL